MLSLLLWETPVAPNKNKGKERRRMIKGRIKREGGRGERRKRKRKVKEKEEDSSFTNSLKDYKQVFQSLLNLAK